MGRSLLFIVPESDPTLAARLRWPALGSKSTKSKTVTDSAEKQGTPKGGVGACAPPLFPIGAIAPSQGLGVYAFATDHLVTLSTSPYLSAHEMSTGGGVYKVVALVGRGALNQAPHSTRSLPRCLFPPRIISRRSLNQGVITRLHSPRTRSRPKSQKRGGGSPPPTQA